MVKKCVFLLLLLSFSAVAELEVYTFDNAQLEQRYQTLTQELRCLVCQNQNIADSHAELAQDLRRKVYEKLKQGQSNQEIIDFMTERYGDFVLYRPPFKAKTLILWLAPVLALICGGAFFYSLKRRGENTSPTLPDNERKKLEQLLQEKD
jgi:cytochrome c-type biogenesis protein CcmH